MGRKIPDSNSYDLGDSMGRKTFYSNNYDLGELRQHKATFVSYMVLLFVIQVQ